MIKISEGKSDKLKYFNLNGLDYEKGIYAIFYSNILNKNNEIDDTNLQIGIKNKHTGTVFTKSC